MISRTTERFWKCHGALSADVKRQARIAFEHFQHDPWHPSLHFKRVHSQLPIYSARISINYRAVGILRDSGIVWFWIGAHDDYDKLLKQM